MKRTLRSGRFSESEIESIEHLSKVLGMNRSDTLRHCVRLAADKQSQDEVLLMAVGDLINELSELEERIVHRTVEEIVKNLTGSKGEVNC